jgi:hypothetical protein
MVGFSLDLDLMGFGTWRRISDFHLFLWLCFNLSGKPSAEEGVLTTDLARWLTAPIALPCPHQPCMPRSALLAPIGLAYPHGVGEGSALVLRIGLRLWQSALGIPSLSLIYKSIVFLLFVSTDNWSPSHVNKALWGAGIISKYFEALATAIRLPGRFAYSFRTELHFAAVIPRLLQAYCELRKCLPLGHYLYFKFI